MTTPARRTFRVSRDTILFAVGLLGIAYETLVEGGDKPTLLVLFGAMVGLPAFLRTDEKAKAKAEAEAAAHPPTEGPQ
jgi:hypothetical protein